MHTVESKISILTEYRPWLLSIHDSWSDLRSAAVASGGVLPWQRGRLIIIEWRGLSACRGHDQMEPSKVVLAPFRDLDHKSKSSFSS